MSVSWPRLLLGSACEVERGRIITKEEASPGSVPVIAGGLGPAYFHDKPNRPAKIVTVSGSGANAGFVNYWEQPIYASDCSTVRPRDDRHDPRFFYYQLLFLGPEIAGLRTGAAQPHVHARDLARLAVVVPPPDEQRRIVTILNAAFERIEAAAANATKIKAAAAALQFSVGELLLARHSQEADHITLEEALQRGWITSHLDGNHGSLYPRAEEFVDSGVPYVSANCIVGDEVDLRRAKYLTPERAASIKKGIATNGDVIFAHNATVGPVAILRTHEERVVLSTSVTYYRCNSERVSAEYLKHFMRSQRFVSQYQAVMRQSTRNQVPITTQRRFLFMFPPLECQEAIASTLEAVEQTVRSIATLAARKLILLAELKQSLLSRAFSGQLTAHSAAANDDAFATPAHVANILALMHWRHERVGRDRFFGRVMGQKTLDLVERVGGVELGRKPYKDAAGPNDRPHMAAAERWAKEQRFFEFTERPGGGYDFKKLANYAAMLSAAKAALKPIDGQLERVADILVGKDSVEAEVFATVLAAWNNLIAAGADVTDAAILHEARDAWHADKMAIPLAKFQNAIREIRRRALVPDGTAKVVGHRQASLL